MTRAERRDPPEGGAVEIQQLAETLWKSADALRGQVDAAEYKHVVLGLLFLKYISDSFESRRDDLKLELEKDGIKGEQLERLLENRDEYTAERVFWVPPESRWPNLQNQATRPEIATLIDDAILAVERDNPNLKNKLPRDYARRGIDPVKMKGLIDLIAGIGFKGSRGKARDTLGRVYEYFLGKFAAAEGELGGEFYTPRSVVRVLVEMLEPYAGRVYDPACGSGGMFVQSEKFAEAHGGSKTDVSIFGQESNPTTWRLAHMNLAIHGIEANLGPQPADTFLRDQHPDLKADFVLANPPLNVGAWCGQLLRGEKRWTYGDPGRKLHMGRTRKNFAPIALHAGISDVDCKSSNVRDWARLGSGSTTDSCRSMPTQEATPVRGAPPTTVPTGRNTVATWYFYRSVLGYMMA
jgi:type I restriction enzyme M protein